jgi:hypothetical protein
VVLAGLVAGGLVVGVSRMPGLGWVRWVWVWVWVRCCLRGLLMPMVVVGIPRGRVRHGRRRPIAGRWRRAAVAVARLGVVRRVRWLVRRRRCALTVSCGTVSCGAGLSGLRRSRVAVRGRLGPESPRCRFRLR